MTVLMSERFISSVPAKELERRRSAVRAAMKAQGLDCLVVQNNDRFLGGYVRYFLDVPAGGYFTTVLFSTGEGTAVINHGATSGTPLPTADGTGEIVRTMTFPYVQALNFTNSYAADAAIKLIREWNCGRIGLVNLGMIQASFYQRLREELTDVGIVDATDLVDDIKAIKSADEIKLIRQSVAIHDYLARAVSSIFRPKRYEYEVRNELRRLAADLGCEGLNIMVGSDAKRPLFGPTIFPERRIEPGDMMMCLIEVSGPGGYFGEIGRTWCLGETPVAIQEATAAAREVQDVVARMAKPGVRMQDLLDANDRVMASRGYPPEARLFAHGQGYDMVERPAVMSGERMVLKEGMFLSIHPKAIKKDAVGFLCDNFLVTADGVEWLTQTPRQLIMV